MSTYIMSIKTRDAGDRRLNSVIWRKEASTLSEAKDYFVRLKDLTEEQFDELYIVTEAPTQ
jgi:hypothetical protein